MEIWRKWEVGMDLGVLDIGNIRVLGTFRFYLTFCTSRNVSGNDVRKVRNKKSYS